MNKKQIIKFLRNNMKYIGFGNYDLIVKFVGKSDCLARITPTEYGQQLEVVITDKVVNSKEKTQINILLHELIHGRECLKQERVKAITEKIQEREEELCVNDTTTLAQEWEYV